MAGNDVFAHVIALHGLVDGVSVVDEEGDPLPVPAVGADTDVVPVAEDHNVPGLPLGGIVQLTGQHLGVAAPGISRIFLAEDQADTRKNL